MDAQDVLVVALLVLAIAGLVVAATGFIHLKRGKAVSAPPADPVATPQEDS